MKNVFKFAFLGLALTVAFAACNGGETKTEETTSDTTTVIEENTTVDTSVVVTDTTVTTDTIAK